jgi:hypothetical protein
LKTKQIPLLAVVFVCAIGIVNAAEPTSPEIATKALEKCLSSGWLKGAQVAAKQLGRSLTTDELNRIVDINVEPNRRSWKAAVEAVKLGASRDRVDSIFEACKWSGYFNDCTKKLIDLGMSRDRIDAYLFERIHEGDIITARQVTKLLGRTLAVDELDTIVDVRVHRQDLRSVDSFYFTIETAKLGVARDRLDAIVSACLDRYELLGFAVEAAQLGASPEVITKLLDACVREGYFDGAVQAARVIGRSLTPDELEAIIPVCARRGDMAHARTAAKLIGRPLTTDELNNIVDARLYYYSAYNTSPGDEDLRWAIEAAKLGASRDRVERLLGVCLRLQSDRFYDVQKLTR